MKDCEKVFVKSKRYDFEIEEFVPFLWFQGTATKASIGPLYMKNSRYSFFLKILEKLLHFQYKYKQTP